MTNLKELQDKNEEIQTQNEEIQNDELVKKGDDLLKSEKRFKSLFQNVNSIMSMYQVVLDNNNEVCDFEFLDINNEFEKVTGFKKEHLIGKTLIELFPRTEQYWLDQLKETYITGISSHTENYSTELNMFVDLGCFISQKGQLVLTGINITDKKVAEVELLKSEEKYRTLSDNIPDVIYSLDKNGDIIATNKAIENYGYSSVMLIGSQFIKIICPEDIDIVTNSFLEAIKTKRKYTRGLRFRIIAKDKTIHWMELTSHMRFDEKGNYYQEEGVLRDITEQIKIEKDNKFLQEQVFMKEKMDSIGVLAGGIAHDFNNLLMGIQGNASLMALDTSKDDINYERIMSIESQVKSGSSLTRQLLGFARGGKYEAKVTNMNEIIKDTLSLFSRTKKEITIDYELDKELWNVEVDHGQMDQILMNLFINAGHAMPSGGYIYVNTKNTTITEANGVPEGDYVKIIIKDTGMGMDEKTRLRIFEPFFTTKEMGRGTGLGLATVYGIIKNHNGFIYVESSIGVGTTFFIYLPKSYKEEVKIVKTKSKIVGGSETILVIDDEKYILTLNKDLLEHIGYKVYTAGNGQEGIAIFSLYKENIDIIVLDMVMPGLSGSDTFDKLREIDPNVKVLLSSGYSISGDATKIMNRGCNGFIQKPFLLAELSVKLREMLDN